MPVTIHLSSETSAWRYIIPALFNFIEAYSFSWEVCRYSEGFLDADKALLKDNENVFSFVPPGREQYAAKWLKLHGAPSPEIIVYCWSTGQESLITSAPLIQLPILREDLNGFLLHLKSIHTLRPLNSLLNERAVHPRDRILLRQILSEQLMIALGKQLTAASMLQPRLPVVDEEVSTIYERTEDLWQLPAEVDPPHLITSTLNAYEPAEVEDQPVTEEDIDDSSNYLIEDIFEEFTDSSEHCPHWSVGFSGNQHLPLLIHIDQYGCITEAEIIKMLNDTRAARRFTTKLEQYSKLLPFDIKVQTSPTGSRYTKSNN
jgi:hypothetical protein